VPVRPGTVIALGGVSPAAAYEATLLAAAEQSSASGSNIVLLRRVCGGTFGHVDEWIDDAIVRVPAIVAPVAAAGSLCEMPSS
jgi:hypothetical protein